MCCFSTAELLIRCQEKQEDGPRPKRCLARRADGDGGRLRLGSNSAASLETLNNEIMSSCNNLEVHTLTGKSCGGVNIGP